ncbi:MAG: decaprenyl-phosphate phosphoribosyltransferase, partial [Armatimonadota bacterium]
VWCSYPAVFVLAGVVFTRHLADVDAVLSALVGFGCFCLLSGCAYIMNDIADREADRRHPEKRERPIASGRLSVRHASVGCALILGAALAISFRVGVLFGVTALGYFLLTVLYSVKLRSVVIIDVCAIAAGFVLRVVAGVLIVGTQVSPWILTCTLFVALLLAFCKRRHELVTMGGSADGHRRVLAEYDVTFLDQMIGMASSVTILSYVLYSFTSETAALHPYLMLTIPFVVYGVARYLYLVFKGGEGGSPDVTVFTDGAMLGNGALYLLAVIAALYFGG